MRYGTIAAAGLLIAMSAAQAQESKPVRLEVRPFAGRYLPTGTQGGEFKQAPTFGVQGALELSSNIHVLASVGWTDGETKNETLALRGTQMLQSDLGIEANGVREIGTQYLLRPFAGIGAGARSYRYKEPGVANSTTPAGYLTLGSELQRSAVALRLELRGYVSRFNVPLNDETQFRNDMAFMFGLAYHIN